MDTNPGNANRQIARAAGVVMIAFVIGHIAGLARRIIIANAFGTGLEMDAFNAANRVSETLFNLVSGGALASAFIPTITGLLARGKQKDAWRLASSIANLTLIVLIILSGLAAIFAPQIVRYALAPGFASNPVKEQLTIELLRLMLPSAVIFGLSGLVMGILNSNQIFLIPALTPSMYQIGLIVGVLFLVPERGIHGLAYGVLLGSGLHLGLQIPTLIKLRGKYSPIIDLSSGATREVIRLLGPRLLGVGVVQLNFWVNNLLASQQAEGSVTGIEYGFALMLMPQALIAQSVATAAMPTLSKQYTLGKLQAVKNSLAVSLRGVFLLSIPASVGLIILRKPIIMLLYQRGEFTSHSTELVAWALTWYAAGLVGHSVVEVLARTFYALHDTKTPVIVGSITMGLNIALSFSFSSLFSSLGWMPHGGLALANSLATFLEMIALFWLMRNRLQGIEGRKIITGVIKNLVAAALMALGIFGWTSLMVAQPIWVISLGGVMVGGVIYLLTIGLLRVDEVGLVIDWIRRRRST